MKKILTLLTLVAAGFGSSVFGSSVFDCENMQLAAELNDRQLKLAAVSNDEGAVKIMLYDYEDTFSLPVLNKALSLTTDLAIKDMLNQVIEKRFPGKPA